MGKKGTKILVAYFSVTGTTKNFATMIADITKGELFEIKPANKYQESDLDWQDTSSRTVKEKNDPNCRPELAKLVPNFGKFETVFIGFPIWWFTAPKIINSFLDSHDFTGKKVIPFITSFGTDIMKADSDLKDSCKSKPNWIYGKRFGSVDADLITVKHWVDSLNI